GNLPKSIRELRLTYSSAQSEEVLRLINMQENLVELTVEQWRCKFFEFLDKLSNLKNSLVKLTLVDFIIDDTKEDLEYLSDIRTHFPKLEQLILMDCYDSNTFFVLSRELQDSFTLKEKTRDFKKWVTKSNV
ncbi:627_t:CDS:1, partial [Paraglomus occultum]